MKGVSVCPVDVGIQLQIDDAVGTQGFVGACKFHVFASRAKEKEEINLFGMFGHIKDRRLHVGLVFRQGN